MKVSVAILPKSVVVTELTQQDGRWVSTDVIYEVPPEFRLARVPYERLRAMGDGIHELIEDGRYELKKRIHEVGPPAWWGWIFFAFVCFLLTFGGYWFFANWEAEGGRIKIHWTVALIYAIGGKWAVGGTFAALSVLLTAIGMRTLITGIASLAHKRQTLTAALEELAIKGGPRGWLLSLYNKETARAVWLFQQDGRYEIRLPLQFLDEKESHRAAKRLGPLNHPPQDETTDDDARGNAWYEIDMGPEVDRCVDCCLQVFRDVYGLVPHFELTGDYSDEEWEIPSIEFGRPVGHVIDQFDNLCQQPDDTYSAVDVEPGPELWQSGQSHDASPTWYDEDHGDPGRKEHATHFSR